MPERSDLEAIFLSHLPATERILSAMGRRHCLSRDAAEEFAAWARLKLIENDYAILSKFRGESSLPTYLTVVIAMLFREYRIAQWGRWRNSAAARRSGDLAVRLETLVQRDGIPIAQAGQVLRTAGATTLSDRELAAIASQFPRRPPLRPIEVGDPPAGATSEERADDLIDDEESAAEVSTVKRALRSALETLDSEEQLIVRLHYMEAMSVADIARGLALPQKPLYRRLERALGTLRARLERAGVSRDQIRSVASGPP